MKAVVEFIKSTLIGGLLVILPLGLVAMIILKIAGMLKPIVAPIVKELPSSLHFPNAIAVVLVFLACFVTGLVAQARQGQAALSFLEGAILDHIPGYSMLRSLTRRIGDHEESERFAPAFAEIEEALVPAFVVEKHEDGRYTVFVPSAPTPGVGAIYIMDEHRVHFVDAPFLKTVKCVSSWGAGSAELLKAIRKTEEQNNELKI